MMLGVYCQSTVLLLSLVFPSIIVAQDFPCRAPNGESNITVYDQDDLDQIASSCSEAVRSTIVIALSWKGPADFSTIKTFEGTSSIRAESVPGLTSVSAPSLVTLPGRLSLYDCVNLVNVSFPSLKDVQGLDLWMDSSLENVDISGNTDGAPSASSISLLSVLLYNTSISNFVFNLTSTEDTLFSILANRNLENLDLSKVETASVVAVGRNNPDTTVNLSNLTKVFNVTFSEIADVTIPQLDTIDGSVSLSNTSLTTFEIGRLRYIRDSLIIRNNPRLTRINFGNVSSIGTNLTKAYRGTPPAGLYGNLTVTGNPLLYRFNPDITAGLTPRPSINRNNSGLDGLIRVYGNVTIEGPFEYVDLPTLLEVNGYFSINSSDPTYSCTDSDRRIWSSPDYSRLSLSSGNYTCRAHDAGSESTKDVAEHCCKPMSSPTKAGIGVGVALGVLALVLIPAVWIAKRKGVFARWRARYAAWKQGRAAEKRAKADRASASAPASAVGQQPVHVDAGPVNDDAPPPAYDAIRPAGTTRNAAQSATALHQSAVSDDVDAELGNAQMPVSKPLPGK